MKERESTVRDLREQGKSYKEIVQATGLSPNTVNSYIRAARRGLTHAEYQERFLRDRGIKPYQYVLRTLRNNGYNSPAEYEAHQGIKKGIPPRDGKFSGADLVDPARLCTLPYFDTYIEREELSYLLFSLIDNLPQRQRAVVEGRYFSDKTLKDLAKDIGITQEGVRQIEIRALEKLRYLAIERNLKLFLESA
jgi:RNA polymerase sigma factor (sigma-70 family)